MFRTGHHIRKLLVFGAICAFSACESEEMVGPPCDMSGQCLPSFICRAGRCVSANDTTMMTNCDSQGCELLLSDEATLSVPPLALTSPEFINITNLGKGAVQDDWTPLSNVFLIEPTDLLFQSPATIEFRVATDWGLGGEDLVVYSSSELDNWKPLTGSFDDNSVRGELGNAGYLFLGRR